MLASRYIIGTLLLLISFGLFLNSRRDSQVNLDRPFARAGDVGAAGGDKHGVDPRQDVKVEIVDTRKESSKCDEMSYRQTLLLTYGRSGSTLTADIIQKHDSVFYFFEPLHNLAKTFTDEQKEFMRTHDGQHLHLTGIPLYQERSNAIIEKLMTCDYKDLPKIAYLNLHMKSSPSTLPLVDCLQRQKSTGGIKKCLAEGEESCKDKQMQFLKIIRFTPVGLDDFMVRFPCLKIIHLVRDPRGSYLSKKKTFGFITSNTTYEADRYCVRLLKDIQALMQLKKQYPNRVLITRYESIAEQPLKTSRELYEFLGLEFTRDIESYIYANTMGGKEDKDRYSVKRSNSSESAYAWRHTIDYHDVRVFDTVCAEVYYQLGYIPVNSEKELRNNKKELKFPKANIS